MWTKAFGFAGGAGGVEDVERVFGVHPLARAVGCGGGHGFVPPDIPAGLHDDCGSGALVDDYGLNGRAFGKSFVGDGFELYFGAAAVAAVLGEKGNAGGVVDAVDEGLRGEASEDDRVDGAYAGAGKESDGEFGGHTHIDGDPVALLDAVEFEDIGEALDLSVEFGVGDAADFAGFALPEDGDLVGRCEGVPVDSIVAEVQLAIDKPFGVGKVAFEYLRPGGEPV